MAKKSKIDWKKVGHYSFIAGIVLAVLLPLVPDIRVDVAVWVLVGLGILVGLVNVTAEETTGFLVVALTLIVASATSALALAAIWTPLTTMLGNVIVFVSPAATVVALKTVYALAQN